MQTLLTHNWVFLLVCAGVHEYVFLIIYLLFYFKAVAFIYTIIILHLEKEITMWQSKTDNSVEKDKIPYLVKLCDARVIILRQ